MKLELKPGETITIIFEGTDGEISVTFGENALRVTADMPDSTGREGVIYEEQWNNMHTERVRHLDRDED